MATHAEIAAIIKTVMQHTGLPETDIEASSLLYDGGLGLDSLSAAELSAALEKAFGKDPYTQGKIPQTVGEITEFYAAAE